MASGDYLLTFYAHDAIPVREAIINPSDSAKASISIREGGSTPGERIIGCWPITQNASQRWDFIGVMPQNYAGGGLTCVIWTVSDTGAAGNITAWIAFRAFPDDTEDLDSAHAFSFQNTTEAMANVAGEFSNLTITFTDGAQMDSLAAGELFYMRLSYTASGAGKPYFMSVTLTET
jgi:hypothetical protein